MTRLGRAGLALFLLLLAGSAGAQTAPPAAVDPFQDPVRADNTRQRLQDILETYPPAVRRVLQLDPSLIDRPDYLSPYPQLVAFLQQHPEIRRNPAFFFGETVFRERDAREAAMDLMGGTLAGFAFFLGFMTVMTLLASLARQVVDYRRWLRQSRVQTEVHTKILDRLGSNEDLLTYIQTPAGRRFLESGPMAVEGAAPAVAAPIGRILWSVQAGVLLTALGVGLWLVEGQVMPEVAPAFSVMSVIVVALGLGAAASAGVAYALSTRLGLMPPAARPQQE